MAAHSTVYNPTGGPVTLDRAGRIVGAGEWAAAKTDAQPVRGHLEAGRLLAVDRPADVADEDLDPRAAAAFRAAADASSEAAPAAAATDTPEEL